MMLNKNLKMKDRGVAWLGQIPEGWEVRKVSRIFNKIGSGTTPNTSEKKYYKDGIIKWVNTGDLNDGVLEDCEKTISTIAMKELSSLTIYPANSLVVAMYGATIGKISILNFDSTVNQACCVLTNSDVANNVFIFYWFIANKKNIINLGYGGGQPNISQDIVRSLKIPLPPQKIQNKIVTYLDEKTAQIWKFVDDKKKMIGLLKEQKQAIIHQAITKGINKNAKMKDSGIAWLGQIPEGWKMLKFKFLYKASMGATILAQDLIENGQIPVYSATESDKIFGYVNDSSVILEKDDLVIPARGNSIGNLMIVKEERATSTQTTIYAKKLRDNKNNIDFIFHYCKSLANHLFEYEVTAIPQITVGQVKENPMLIPPIEIQKKIVAHIKKETSQIDTAIKKIEQEIELVEEYKKSLIFHAVTGKITIN